MINDNCMANQPALALAKADAAYLSNQGREPGTFGDTFPFEDDGNICSYYAGDFYEIDVNRILTVQLSARPSETECWELSYN